MRPAAATPAPATAGPGPATVGGAALRVVLAGAVVTAVALLVVADPASRVTPWAVLVAGLLLAAVVAAPGSGATTIVLLLLAVLVLDSDPGLLLLPVAALVHLVHVLAAVAGLGPAATRFEIAALVPTARRYALAQVAVLPVLAVALLVPRGGGLPPALEVLAALAAAVLVAVVLVLAGRCRRGAGVRAPG